MPNRYIRESARTSATLYQLSHGAERMFWRLTTVADDYGRFESDARVLLANCFPLWAGEIKVSQVATWYGEMEACGLVTTYVVNGKHYGFFPTWEKHQRIRAKHSKYPAPSSDNICGHVLANVPDIRIPNNEERVTKDEDSLRDRPEVDPVPPVLKAEAVKEDPHKLRVAIKRHAEMFHLKTGQPMVIRWVKDSSHLKAVLDTHGPDGLAGLQDKFFKSVDGWWVAKGQWGLAAFIAAVNDLAGGAVAKRVVRPGNAQAVRAFAAEEQP